MSDPFAEPLPRRDQYGRPLIKQPDGSEVAYTRISTLSGYITDKTAIGVWEKQCLAIGLGNDPELAAMAGSFGQHIDNLSKEDKRDLNAVIEQAHYRAGGNDAAHHGTAFHRFTEPDRDGIPPERMVGQVEDFHAGLKTRNLTILDTELFVVNHELRIAGTYDHAVGNPAIVTRYVLDKKTGRYDIPSWIVQLAAYSQCVKYNPQTGETSGALPLIDRWGIVAYAPRGGNEVQFLSLPLAVGHEGVSEAVRVRDWRQRAAKVRPVT